MNKRGKYFSLLLIVFTAACKTVPFKVKDGNTARELFRYNQSIEFLQKEFNAERDPIKQQKIAYNLGESYGEFNDYANAEKWHKQSIDLNAGEQSLYQLGMMQKQQEKYEEAYKTFEQFQRITGGGFEGRRQATQSKEALDWKKSFTRMQVRNLEILNTADYDYTLVPFKQQYVLSSTRSEALGSNRDEWTGENFTDLFIVEKTGEKFSTPVNFGAPVNTPFHESSTTFSADFKEMYFVRSIADEQKTNQYTHIFYSAFNNEHWTEPLKVDPFADSVNVRDPFISKDGKFLYVSADVPGGFGETDLYLVAKNDTGWGYPQNLGGSINTPYSERFPWLDEKGNLYFSSNGLPGMGGLDIFKATRTKSSYKDPVNLKYPINSGADDFGYIIDKYKPKNTDDTVLFSGYFSSNRTGGKGGDDIYRFEEKWINLFVLRGKVVEKDFENPENPDSKVVGLKNLAKAKVELKTTDDKVIATTTTDTAGKFVFKLEAETDYKLTASKGGYFSNNSFASTIGKRHQDSTIIRIYTQIELEKIFTQKMLVIPNIYYDYDKATLRPESKLVLDSITIFFKENPDLKIELGSHTDSRGSDAYNLKLSQARAQSAVDYLISKGVPDETLQAKGYGETKLANNCGNGAKCTEEEHQKNRRTTFRVISAKLTLESVEPENIIVDPRLEEK